MSVVRDDIVCNTVKALEGALAPKYNYSNYRSVTQLTGITTAVTCNSAAGKITTVALTTAAGVVESAFTLNNSYINETSIVFASVIGYLGAGIPIIVVGAVGAGTVTFRVGNGGGSSLNTPATIAFQVIN